jgi:hypothetical protein
LIRNSDRLARAARLRFNRGGAKQTKGDLEGAIADDNQAIELNPKLANATTAAE